MATSDENWTEAKSAEVYACLDKILAHPIFAHAERQQRFLRFIVTETLAGRAAKLKGYAIGMEVFDRKESFDPVIDSIVRVEAARLRTKLREYYDVSGHNDPLSIQLPKGNYAVRIEWRKNESPINPILSHAVAPIEDKPSLAVLPFSNISRDPEQQYFADGITDCLITEISRLPGLFIISRQSSFAYKQTAKRAREIGKELGVNFLLEGSVQRAGDRVRIMAQLANATSGQQLWAERYDREAQDIFEVQDDVTRCIAAIMQVRLGHRASPRPCYTSPENFAAHEELLRGLEHFWQYTRESVEQAQQHFIKAVQFAPSYAAAHVWLSRALTCRWIFLWDLHDEVLDQAVEHARIAIDLDPQQSFGYSVLSWAECWRRNSEAAILAGRHAVALDPNNADALLFLSMALIASNQAAEALRYIEMGIRLNPNPSTFYQLALGFCHMAREDYAQAVETFERGVEISDAFIPNHYWLCAIYTLLGRNEEARIEREKVFVLSGSTGPSIRLLWLDEGLRQRMTQLTKQAGLS